MQSIAIKVGHVFTYIKFCKPALNMVCKSLPSHHNHCFASLDMLYIRSFLLFATLAIVVSAQADVAVPKVAADNLLQQNVLQEGKLLASKTVDVDKLGNVLAAGSSKERRDASDKVQDRLKDRMQKKVKAVNDKVNSDLEQGKKLAAAAANSVHH